MTDKSSETPLLECVRNRIRTRLSLSDSECDVEYDEYAPQTAGDVYIVVTPGGVSTGPAHRGGHVVDELVDVDVTVARRATAKPRDRKREVYLRNLSSLNELVQEVRTAVDFNYDILTAANVLILRDTLSSHGFIEPLKFAGMDKPQAITGDFFAATQEPAAGLKRTIHFKGARRVYTR